MSERRKASRRRVYFGARICHAVILSDTACLVRNLSAGGARVVVGATTPLPDRFDLAIPCRDTTRAVETVWRIGDEVGLRFVTETAECQEVVALRDSRAEAGRRPAASRPGSPNSNARRARRRSRSTDAQRRELRLLR